MPSDVEVMFNYLLRVIGFTCCVHEFSLSLCLIVMFNYLFIIAGLLYVLFICVIGFTGIFTTNYYYFYYCYYYYHYYYYYYHYCCYYVLLL